MRDNAIPHKDILWVGQVLLIKPAPGVVSGQPLPAPTPVQPLRQQKKNSQAPQAPHPAPFIQAPVLADVRSGKAILRLGMAGPAVQEAQRLLVIAHALSQTALNTGPGLFGPATLEAAKHFQRKHRIPPPVGSSSGSIHKPTIEALIAIETATPRRAPTYSAATPNPPIAKASAKPLSAQGAPDDSVFDAVWNWVWGTLQGDFNKNPSLCQIAVNTFFGLVPLVDQALDFRDIIAGLKDIIEYYLEDEREQAHHEETLGIDYELWIWINVFIIAVGCIPEVGSAVKGAIRALIEQLQLLGNSTKGLTPRQLQEAWRYFVNALKGLGVSEQKAVYWVKQLINDLPRLLDQASRLISSALIKLQRLLSQAERTASTGLARWTLGHKGYQQLRSSIGRMSQAVSKALQRLEEMKAHVNRWIREQLSALIQRRTPKLLEDGDPPPPHKPSTSESLPAPRPPRTRAELHALFSEKAKEAYEQQKQLLPENRLQQMEDRFKTNDDTYDADAANAFFEERRLDKEQYTAKLNNTRAFLQKEAGKHIEKIDDVIKETNGANRANATLGDGTTEAALTHEVKTGKPLFCKEGHHAKIAASIGAIQKAIKELKELKKRITDTELLSRIDAFIQDGEKRVDSMLPSLKQWKLRADTHPDVWNADGTSKLKPGWPAPPKS